MKTEKTINVISGIVAITGGLLTILGKFGLMALSPMSAVEIKEGHITLWRLVAGLLVGVILYLLLPLLIKDVPKWFKKIKRAI